MNRDSTSDGGVKPLRSRLKEATREVILDAAEALFGGKGLHGARMEEVAARAGVSVGTVYNYFGDRDALLEALFEARRVDILARMEAALDETKGRPFPERVERFIAGALEYMDEHRRLLTLLLEEELRRTHGGRSPTLREMLPRAERLISEGVKEGAIRSEGAELFPSLLVGLLRTVIFRALQRGEDGPLAARVHPLARFFLEGAGSRR